MQQYFNFFKVNPVNDSKVAKDFFVNTSKIETNSLPDFNNEILKENNMKLMSCLKRNFLMHRMIYNSIHHKFVFNSCLN